MKQLSTVVPATANAKTVGIQVAAPSEGRHRVTVVAVDYAGNRSEGSSHTFLVG